MGKLLNWEHILLAEDEGADYYLLLFENAGLVSAKLKWLNMNESEHGNLYSL